MKRFFFMFGILAVLFACAPMTADAVRPKLEVAPITPPQQIGDDDQPGKDVEGEQPSMKVSNPDQKPVKGTIVPTAERSRWMSRIWAWLSTRR